jgi:hypothetical protein
VSLDFIMASEISRTEAFNSSEPAATDSIMLRTRMEASAVTTSLEMPFRLSISEPI